MELGVLFFILAMALAAGFFISQPMLQSEHKELEKNGLQIDLSGLQTRLESTKAAVMELEMDHALGKLPEETFAARRGELAANGARIMQQMDQLKASLVIHQENGQKLNAKLEDELEVLIATRQRVRKEKISGYCSGCGKPLVSSDKFCPRCGRLVVARD